MINRLLILLVFIAGHSLELCTPNGILEPGESCDLVHPGCDQLACTVRDGWFCVHRTNSTTGKSLQDCFEVCGDGKNLGFHECDDGNTHSRDGCSHDCRVEPGYRCSGFMPDKCTTVCGDGLKFGNEECDDAGLSGGCSN